MLRDPGNRDSIAIRFPIRLDGPCDRRLAGSNGRLDCDYRRIHAGPKFLGRRFGFGCGKTSRGIGNEW